MQVKRDIDRPHGALTPSQRLTLEQADFSLVLGGPVYQLFRRWHLSGEAFELAARRIILISLFAWVPLLLLSVIAEEFWGGTAAVPFLTDVEVHVRFLVAMPLLIVAELVVHRRMRLVVRQFLDRRLIPDDAMQRFDEAIASVMRLRNSTFVKLLLIAIVYGLGVFVIWRLYAVLDKTAWYTVPAFVHSGEHCTVRHRRRDKGFLRRSSPRRSGTGSVNTGPSPSGTCASSMPNGCAAARRPRRA